ncbi:MAG: tRNA-dihydrouridine synthase [Planctomycetaceae bacterium]|nr:tRNA-dihydrouridine synthase [Planctomycetaceae bacterium]
MTILIHAEAPTDRLSAAADRVEIRPTSADDLVSAKLAEPPLQIGARVLPSRYSLAPLAGYTQHPFRVAVRELGGLGLATTDLVQAGLLVSKGARSQHLIATSPGDQPLSVQIFSGKQDELVKAAKWLEDHGYQGIDINMGCPMAKVNSQGGGARLMCDPNGACATVAAVVNAVELPVTVKMRLGWDETQLTAPALAREFERLGAQAITIHGRTREQGFTGTVSLDGIRAVVEAVERIPVIGNGDVRSVADAFHMRKVTGCAGVAIGRGAMLDPWIFGRIEAATRGLPPPSEPTIDEKLSFFVRHFRLKHEQHGEYACILIRKFAAWYGARLGVPEDLENRLRRIESEAQLLALADEMRARHGERQSAIATALIKTPNGPNELW